MTPQGIYTLVSRGNTLDRQMDAVANNLANVDTVGYKQDQPAFQALFAQTMGVASQSDEETFSHHEHLPPYAGVGTSYVSVADMGKDYSTGRLIRTGNDLDFALTRPDGFFSVTTPQGERFTRAGNFRLNQEGQLVSAEGFTVNGKEGPLKLQGEKIRVAEDGTVMVDGKRAGGLRIVTFPYPERLQKLGNSLFAPVDAENAPRILEDVQMVQGTVESSNVEMVKEMARMIEANRAYTQLQRALVSADEMNKGAVTLARI